MTVSSSVKMFCTCKNLLWMVYMCLVLCSCTTSSTPGTSTEKDSLAEVGEPQGVRIVIPDNLRLGLPALLRSGAEYSESVINSLDRVDDYLLTEDKSSLNMGVYGADALYLALFDKTQEYIQYSNVFQRMASEIGVPFGSGVARRLEENVGKPDSIYAIITAFIQQADSSMKENGQDRIAALMATGSLVESLHLLCAVAENSDGLTADSLTELRLAILRQTESIMEVRKRLNLLQQDTAVKSLLDKLDKLQGAIVAVKTSPQAPNQGLTADSLKGVAALVDELRASLVE